MMPSTKYERLPQVERSSQEYESQNSSPTAHRSSRSTTALAIAVLIFTNALTFLVTSKLSVRSRTSDISPFAGLERNVDTVFGGHDAYTDRNDTFRDELWQAINIDDGMVALPYDMVDEHDLPVSQPFPWDDSKGIYLLHGHHNLHCVRSIYISLREYRLGLPQTRNARHILHCLDALRRDVICNADDTPRFTTNSSVPETGRNQGRKCRSWDALNAWATRYNACYRYINETQTDAEFPQVQRFVWCREGSPYRETVEALFDVEWDG